MSGDDATITGLSGATYLVVTGPGTAGTLTALGNVALAGSFTFGTLSVGTASASGALLLAPGIVQTGSATLRNGPIEVRGPGASLRVSGTLTLGGARASLLPDGLDTLIVTGGGAVQAGSVALTGGSYEVNSIAVDAASTVEVGSTGGVAVGTLTVDTGRSLAGAGFLKADNGVVDNGTITAQGGMLSLSSPVTGSGTMQIGAGATLALNAFAQPSAVPVNFAAANGTLQVGSFAGALSESGLITGFGPSDTIAYTPYGGALQSVSYSSSSYGQGTLTLNGANGSLGALRLAGDFSAYSFLVTPDPRGTSDIILIPRGTAAVASPGTTSPDAFVWVAPGSGVWGTAANWSDASTGANPATVAPGANNTVTLRPAGGTLLVSGAGNAASLTVAGAGTVALNGSFAAASLQVGTATESGALSLAGGTTLDVGSANLGGSGLQATGSGTRLNVNSALTLAATLALTGAATARANDALLGAQARLTVDSDSKFEFGNLGTVASGQLQVDAGRTLSGAGLLAAASGIMDNGTITAQGGTLTVASTVAGGGTMRIADGATLALTSLGWASTAGVAFAGANGTLQVTSYNGTLSEAGLISGFALGDSIAVKGVPGALTAAYQPTITGYGRLVLTSGGASLGVLNLGGDFSGYSFAVSATSDGVARVTLAPNVVPTPAPPPTPDTYSWIGGSGAWSNAWLWQDVTTTSPQTPTAPGGANAVLITGPDGASTEVITGPGNAASLTVRGNVTLSGAFAAGSLDARGTTQVVVGGGSQLAIGGAATLGGLLVAANGGRVTAASLTVTGTVRSDANSLVQVGTGAPLGTGIRIEAGATLSADGGQLQGDVSGGGTLAVGKGLTDVSGTIGAGRVAFTDIGAALRVHGLQGTTSVSGMQFGDALDLAGITGARLTGNTLSAGAGVLTLAAAPSGYAYKLYGDARGGTAVLLDPTGSPATAISITDASGTSTHASGDDYAGPVDYLQRQYIWSGSGGVAMAANVPNAFLKGGNGDDALMVQGGNNVLDGGTGSNFLIGGAGTDTGADTFFLDARGGGVTWSTIVNFHQGDQATIFGFNAGSTRPLTASDGVPGYTGVTIHSEIGGAGTGITASMTFTGVDQATAAQHFVYTTGNLPGDIGYLLIQYT